MNITLLVTGKCKEKAILSLEEKYLKNLKKHHKVNIIELAQDKSTRPEEIKSKEGKAQLDKISDDSFVIAMDEKGEQMSTHKFAIFMQDIEDKGTRNIVFVIGGAEGLSEDVKNRANKMIALSQLTFPHMLVRPILLEQIFRAACINTGHPYHRD